MQALQRWDCGVKGKKLLGQPSRICPAHPDATARVWTITCKIDIRTLFVKHFVFQLPPDAPFLI
jgi:hypothetical protein